MVAKQALIDSYSDEYCRLSTSNSTLTERLNKCEALSEQIQEQGHAKAHEGTVCPSVDQEATREALEELQGKLNETEAQLEDYRARWAKAEEQRVKNHERLMVSKLLFVITFTNLL